MVSKSYSSQSLYPGATGRLSGWKKVLYGSGDWGRAGFNTLRQIFYAIFLTDVVGLDPRLASFAALAGVLWDAINDPLIGYLSDRVRTRWGRRRPFLLWFSAPFALAFVLLWWAPPWQSQAMLLAHITLAYMISDTFQTLVTVPYLALTPELASQYDERTSLASYRMFFNLVSSLVTAVAAPMIVDSFLSAGFSIQQGYLAVAGLFGGLALLPLLLLFFFMRERPASSNLAEEKQPLQQTLYDLSQNRPFRFAAGIYVLNWIAVDVVSLMLPFFLLYWVGGGDLLVKINLAGITLSLESAVLGIMLATATLAIPIWNFLAKKFSKRTAYIFGMLFWVFVQASVWLIQPGAYNVILALAFFAGISVSTAHVMPEAIFPDVIDWDELRTRTRREGIYYGSINFIRKLSSAVAIFLVLQMLGWTGYMSPPAGSLVFTQPPTALLAIRIMTGPFVCLLLIAAIIFAKNYPLSRERQARIQHALSRRQQKPISAD